MSIFYENLEVLMPEFKYNQFDKIIKSVIKSHNFKMGDVSFIFCSDAYLLDLNTKFLNHDYFTDVITFDYCMNNSFSGDVFISLERVKENATLFDQHFIDELIRVMAHGILHILGYKDKKEEEIKVMRCKEDEILEKYNSMLN